MLDQQDFILLPFTGRGKIKCLYSKKYGAKVVLNGMSSSFVACNSRLRSAIRRHHPPQRAVLSQICCFGERKMVMF